MLYIVYYGYTDNNALWKLESFVICRRVFWFAGVLFPDLPVHVRFLLLRHVLQGNPIPFFLRDGFTTDSGSKNDEKFTTATIYMCPPYKCLLKLKKKTII